MSEIAPPLGQPIRPLRAGARNEVGNRYGRMTVVALGPMAGRRRLWLCRCDCGKVLSVRNFHHKSYRREAKPWEYDDFFLLTLCENCHEAVTVDSKAITELVADYGPRGAAAARRILEAFFGENSRFQNEDITLDELLGFITKGSG